jgi:hypothetical protein
MLRRRLSEWVFGTLVVLRIYLSPAHASLMGSVLDAAQRLREALPVRVEIGLPASLTAAQRDSVRRVRLARLASLAGEQPPAWSEDFATLPHGVRLSFRIADTVSRDVTVKWREGGARPQDGPGEWRAIGRVRADKLGHGTWRDSTTRFGKVLELALSLRTTHGTRLVPMPPVRLVESGLTLSARLEPDGGAVLALRLPTGYPATLELFDVSGRSVGAIDVSRLMAGAHEVRVPVAMLRSRGVYFARLSQRGEWACDKFVVTR